MIIDLLSKSKVVLETLLCLRDRSLKVLLLCCNREGRAAPDETGVDAEAFLEQSADLFRAVQFAVGKAE